MSKPYVIYTDVTSDLPKEILLDMGIHHLPMPYILDGKEYSYDLVSSDSPTEFYTSIRKGKDCNTYVPQVDYYYKHLEKYISQGMDILYITVSSKVSDTYSRLVETKQSLKENYPHNDLIVVDSKRLSGALGLIVLKAVEMQRLGASLGEVYQWIEHSKLGFRALFMVDDVYYLKRRTEAGQAISASSAHLAMFLQVKPIMHIDGTGRPDVYDKTMGKRNVIEQFAKITAEKAYEPSKNILFICHSDCLENAQKLKKKIESKVKFKDIIITSISPIIGSHIGAGSLGIAYLGQE